MDATTPLGGDGGGRALGGRYLLRGLIGQGGMADVEMAVDRVLDRRVAVKILHARYADDPDFIARFRREAQAAASLSHPNVVQVYDTGADDGRPYIVMELVSGKSLRDVLRSERIPTQRAAAIAGDAALGLHYAHERGLVHRDVKPGNILVDDEGTVKVADFGIARAVSAETVTQTAAVFGTAAYIAPEQAQGEPVDRRTDVYALGCVLYETLTGRQPFAADSAVALAYKHVSETPVPPSRVNPDVGPQLDAVVMKAMAKAPADRYQTARDFQQDLSRAAGGMAVSAPPPGSYEATQVVRREADPTLVAAPRTRVYEREEPAYERVVEEPRRKKGIGAGVVLLSLLVLALFIVAGFLLRNLFLTEDEPPPAAPVEVPNVDGQDIVAATSALQAAGFTVELDPQDPAPGVPPDQVIRTEPAGGSQAEQGSSVRILFSPDPAQIPVPDLSNQTAAQAQQRLAEEGLALGGQGSEPSAEVSEGQIISQDPVAGTPVEEGSAVDIVVSAGQPLVTVPNVDNLPQDDAEAEIEELGLEVEVSEANSETIAEGRVIRSDPGPGGMLEPGSTVEIVVSLGPEETEEPEPEPEPTQEPEPEPEPEPTQPPATPPPAPATVPPFDPTELPTFG